MLTKIGEKFTDFFKKYMPDAFVFAIILTFITGISSLIILEIGIFEIISSWYKGFWTLLEFGMQMVLIIVTGYAIALSPLINKQVDKLSQIINTPIQVYYFVTLLGILVSLISWGWIVIVAVLARELALRVKGIHYPFLIACTYFSTTAYVCGLSSSIPLLLNTKGNYLIKTEIIERTISTDLTLGSSLNITILLIYVILAPLLFILIRPKNAKGQELNDLLISKKKIKKEITIKEEAESQKLPFKAISDNLNNSSILMFLICFIGFTYLTRYFYFNGFDLNFNIMIFIFLFFGMFLHRTPIRYGIALRKASNNVSGIILQFPFYAGIMGIMIHTGLGGKLADLISDFATVDTYPFFCAILGGVVNFAIPSAGGEFAVIGPSVIEAIKEIGNGLNEYELIKMIARASMSVAYGETLTNLLHPFYLLLIIPIMGVGVNLQARDVMGYLVLPFILCFTIISLLITYMPL